MSGIVAVARSEGAVAERQAHDFVTLRVDRQLFGISVTAVRDVLRPQPITPVPLAPDAVAGTLTVRGRIVTAIDVRARLGLGKTHAAAGYRLVGVEHQGDSYGLIVDSAGEVVSLPLQDFEHNPVSLPAAWRQVSMGIYRLKDELLVVLNVEKLLTFS